MNILLAGAIGLLALSCTSRKPDYVTMLAGTYSSEKGEGIYAFRFDQNTGAIDSARGHISLSDASYLTLNQSGTVVYAVSEKHDSTAALAAFGFDKDSLTFKPLSHSLTLGEDPCYVSSDGSIAVTANYSGGSVSVFRLGSGGAVKDSVPFQKLYGTTGGPDTSRQASPHVHCAVFAPDGGFLLASDFSADRIISFRIEGDSLAEYSDVALDKDFGPRHILFNGSGTVYVIGELSGKVSVLGYQDGRLTLLQTVECDHVHARGSADIRMTPDGRFLFASNRLKNDGVMTFSIGKDGRLAEAGYCRTGGHPRNICVTPNGKFLLVACRDADKIEVYRIDRKTGQLNNIDKDIVLGKPVCIKFCPV